jgi:NAD(P)-dependent dehydrogenase (short-subunit alcohol dehydrogenase family)
MRFLDDVLMRSIVVRINVATFNYLPGSAHSRWRIGCWSRRSRRAIARWRRKAVAIPGDIKDEALCGKLVVDAARELGGLNILVNNAAREP